MATGRRQNAREEREDVRGVVLDSAGVVRPCGGMLLGSSVVEENVRWLNANPLKILVAEVSKSSLCA